MSKILATPAARIAADQANIDLSTIKGTGEYGSIRLSDVLSAAPAEAKIKATPVAKNVAAYYNKDLGSIAASGAKITKADVLSAVSAEQEAPAAVNRGEIVTKPLTGMRKSIADNMMNSLQNLAQYTQMAEIDTTEMIAFFKEAKETYKKFSEEKLTITDILVKIVSMALAKNPGLNATLEDNTISEYPYVNMGVAVSIEGGLVVPVIKNTDTMSLYDISKHRKTAVNKAREGKAKGKDFKDGTFTISNLGNCPVNFFTPVINPPQVAILGVGKTEEKPVVKDGEIVIRNMTYFSLTMDHRAVDGMIGVEFLKTLEELIQNPMCVLL